MLRWPLRLVAACLFLTLILFIAFVPAGARQEERDAFELNEMTVAQLQRAMIDGKYTSRKLVDLYLTLRNRRHRYDAEDPRVHSQQL